MKSLLPNHVNDITVLHFIKDAIAAENDEIVLLFVNLECDDIWLSNHDRRVTIKTWEFSLNISEGLGN